MKSKKLIILLSAAAVFIAVIIIIASVFSVREVAVNFHNFAGSQTLPSEDSPTADDVLKISKGKSMFFASKDKILDALNKEHTQWHAFAVVKNFPDILEVHFVKREAVVKLDVSGHTVYIDSFGYVVSEPERECIDISSAFLNGVAENSGLGEKFKFVDSVNDARLTYILETIIASWQCNLELDDLPAVLGENNVFSFDENGNMLIKMRSGAIIKVVSPETNLTKRIISAYSMYYNNKENVQQSGTLITVEPNGTIIVPKDR
ncbi:MAG: hypothetical protein NC099_03935 [Corallococcus sp.]|nr:hypothetical protein [Bacillota bacterium]MCM1533785.1 hypothetical protein [Corallococcus sp.]